MVTPFDSDGSVNYAVAEALASYLADHGSDGIVVCGTTGESPTLTWDEQYQLFKTVQHAVSGKAKVIAGTGSNSTSEAIEATKKANRLGLDGSLQVVPYYNKPPQEGLCRHFGAIARAVPDLPLMLYNIPGRTGQSLSVESVTYLSSNYPNVVAIKEATGSIDFASQIRGGTPDNFAIYSGDDSLTLPLLAVGGAGVVSVASHLVGDQLQEMIQAFEAGKIKEATKLHLQMMPLFKALFMTTNPIPVKAALALKGWSVDALRPPLCEAPEEVIATLQKILVV